VKRSTHRQIHSMGAPRPNGRCANVHWPASINAGKPDRELTALRGAAAGRGHAAVVQFHQRSHERKANAETWPGFCRDLICAPEQIEYMRQQLWTDADARVPDADEGLIVPYFGDDIETTPVLGVLDRVAQQVHEYLFQSEWIAFHPQGR
jgi:hypothetical protein